VRLRMPDVLLLVAGEGPALEWLRRRVAKRGLGSHVRFVGYLNRDDSLLDCYKSANVFVFASRTETQGLVLLEAMALGVPVVSTAVMGTKTVLDGAPGAVVADENIPQFAAAVERMLADRALGEAAGAQAAEFVARRWSSDAKARQMLELYTRISCARVPATSRWNPSRNSP
jgi:1,2-diacylglycerol 3-alpha-glucosyltransferase